MLDFDPDVQQAVHRAQSLETVQRLVQAGRALGFLSTNVDLSLVRIDTQAIEVTPLGWYFVRALAMVFDRHLRADAARERFCRVI